MKKKKAFWDTKNPKKKSTPHSDKQKSAARARAKAAGRPYPNLIDNAWASKQKQEIMAGIYGSTLLSELNRLANGGTYPAISEFVGMALATK